MPQQQFVAGGDFSSALSELAKAKLADVRQELREVGKEIALITPSRNVPLSEQQAVRESGAAVFIGGASADASSPEVMPLLRTMGFSPFVPGAAPPPHPTLGLPGSQASSVPAAVVSLGDLTAALPPSPHAPGCHTSGAGDAELARLAAERMVKLVQAGVPPPCVSLCWLKWACRRITCVTCRGSHWRAW